MSNDVFRAEGQSRPGPPYEARYGPAWHDLWVLPVTGACFAAGVVGLLRGDTVFSLLVLVAPSGAYLVLRAAQLVLRRIALRVDATGIRLGRCLPVPSGRDQVLPWSDVQEVHLERQVTTVAWRPREISVYSPRVRHSRLVVGWRLDREAFAAAVARHAPSGVSVVDLS